jgi:D-amino-acid oxidase
MKKLSSFSILIALILTQQPLCSDLAPSLEEVYLRAPNLADENIIGFNVGVRPYRRSGIRLESEQMEEKIVIHNYGYGGSGLTLCWGGAEEVLSILDREKIKNPLLDSDRTIAVLGAGVIGLATAYELLNRGYAVHIYADEFSPNLTSNIAAGIWSPPASQDETQKKLIAKILDISDRRFRASASSESPEFAGVRILTGYDFKKADSGSNGKFQASSSQHKLVRVHFDNGITKIGKQNRQLGLDGKIFMDDLYAKTIAKGAVIYHKHFSDRRDVAALDEKIIINCTSLGSRELFNDEEFIPIRGHLVYFQSQEGVDYILSQNVPEDPDYWVALYPCDDRLILGGLFEKGLEELQVDQNVTNKLIQNARNCFNIECFELDK